MISTNTHPALSVIVPFFNEEENVSPLYQSLKNALDSLGESYEMIFIDDGSRDATLHEILKISERDKAVTAIELVRNFGQTAAMMAGIDHARGDIIISMDGDGQNDPADIPRLLSEIKAGYDVVSGWRVNRKDRAISRRLPSRVANFIISKISGVHLHDYGCSLKAYRHDVIKNVNLYGEMHRFIPIYASWYGGKIAEIPVNHFPRQSGTSKYGLNRIFKVVLDLIVVLFLERYLTKPIYLFGGFGLISLLASMGSFLWMLWLKLVDGKSFIATPLPILTAVLGVTGILAILMGLVAELLIRTYHESQGKRAYMVRRLHSAKEP